MYTHEFHRPAKPRPRSRPTIVFGGSAGLFGGAQRAIRQAVQDGYLAVDLDLRHAILAPSMDAIRLDLEPRVMRVRSIWLPATLSGPFTGHRMDRLEAFLRLAQRDLGLRHIIIEGASQATRAGAPILPMAQEVAQEQKGMVRLGFGVRADRSLHSLDSTRLARRVAEEWDLDLALDVAGPVPPGWEAEAAVARLLPRLAVVRLCGWLPMQFVHEDGSPTRIAARTMAMLADQGYAGLLSIVPTRHRRPSTDYQHDLQRRYDSGPHSADTPARTYFDLP